MSEPTPEAVEGLRRILGDHWAAGMARSGAPAEWECVCDVALEMSDEAHQAHTAREVLAAGYVHLVTYLNSLTASERLELGDALCREAAEMDEDECIDDTDLCEHGLRFGCEDC